MEPSTDTLPGMTMPRVLLAISTQQPQHPTPGSAPPSRTCWEKSASRNDSLPCRQLLAIISRRSSPCCIHSEEWGGTNTRSSARAAPFSNSVPDRRDSRARRTTSCGGEVESQGVGRRADQGGCLLRVALGWWHLCAVPAHAPEDHGPSPAGGEEEVEGGEDRLAVEAAAAGGRGVGGEGEVADEGRDGAGVDDPLGTGVGAALQGDAQGARGGLERLEDGAGGEGVHEGHGSRHRDPLLVLLPAPVAFEGRGRAPFGGEVPVPADPQEAVEDHALEVRQRLLLVGRRQGPVRLGQTPVHNPEDLQGRRLARLDLPGAVQVPHPPRYLLAQDAEPGRAREARRVAQRMRGEVRRV